ncbi:2-aminoethanethiol dioxygenase [Tachypleus tridentatus]|uniref:2-aminoethanethiol dioxygenase n=1 Tax=Tachypleus tridentatus TaxID=6853 RepID=UPI003FD57185
MAGLIQSVARQAQATFSRSITEESFGEYFSSLHKLVNQVRAPDVNLNQDLLKNTKDYSLLKSKGIIAPVTYVGMYEDHTFSMGIFVVKNGAKIPLHDHPHMCGILKVLHGKLSISSFNSSITNGKEYKSPEEILAMVPPWQKHRLFPAKQNRDIIASPDSEPCVLTPKEGNYHEITALDGPAAFLDILAPPYDMKERDCHYYRKVGETRQEGRDSKISWLVEIPAPTDFWCNTSPYLGPNVHI